MSNSVQSPSDLRSSSARALGAAQDPQTPYVRTSTSVNASPLQPDEARQALSEAIELATASADAAASYAKRQPLKALVAAVLVGVVVGRLLW